MCDACLRPKPRSRQRNRHILYWCVALRRLFLVFPEIVCRRLGVILSCLDIEPSTLQVVSVHDTWGWRKMRVWSWSHCFGRPISLQRHERVRARPSPCLLLPSLVFLRREGICPVVRWRDVGAEGVASYLAPILAKNRPFLMSGYWTHQVIHETKERRSHIV